MIGFRTPPRYQNLGRCMFPYVYKRVGHTQPSVSVGSRIPRFSQQNRICGCLKLPYGTLGWGGPTIVITAISSSEPFKWYLVVTLLCVCQWLSCVQLFAIPWTVAHLAPLSMHFPGKNTGVGSHFLLQRIFSTQGLNPGLLHCRQILYHWATREAQQCY